MSDLVAPVIEHLMGMYLFFPWLVWFCRELVVHFFKGSTKLSILTGLALTLGVLIQNGSNRMLKVSEVVTSYEVYIGLFLIIITLIKIQGQSLYAKRDVPMVFGIAIICLLVALDLKVTILVAVVFGAVLGVVGIAGSKYRDTSG